MGANPALRVSSGTIVRIPAQTAHSVNINSANKVCAFRFLGSFKS